MRRVSRKLPSCHMMGVTYVRAIGDDAQQPKCHCHVDDCHSRVDVSSCVESVDSFLDRAAAAVGFAVSSVTSVLSIAC